MTNKERALRQRAWYYTRIYADTEDVDKVYVVNVAYHVSKDGGNTFESAYAPHGDHHDLWIAPEDANRLIIADDGGAQVSFDAGANWTTYHNQPTAQFYRVTTDDHFPYRVYGAQQDNSAIRIEHRSDGTYIDNTNWESTAGGESAHLAIDPTNNDIVYGGSYGGYLSRYNHKTNELQVINVWPDNPMGYGAEGMKYRFQWNFPVFFSPHNASKLYTASNHLHVSTDQGKSWKVISPDLTRNDSTKLGSSGGPITKDNTGVEYYCTIFAAAESTHEPGVIWTGSDDGLIHITRNNGDSWSNVTPFILPKWTMINSIEIDPFNKGGLYVAGTRYKLGDYQPYLYKTEDYGQSWKKITTGIQNDHFTRVLRADPVKQGVLYAGTESGMYISFNDGELWQKFQLNLPVVPITDLALKNNNLIAATQGRSFWVIDDLTIIHQLNSNLTQKALHLFKPMETYRMSGGGGKESKTKGENHPGGALIHYFVKDTSKTDTLVINILDNQKTLIQTFSTHPKKENNELLLEPKNGLNTLNWNLRYPGPEKFDGMILWWVSMNGPMAIPGKYTVELAANGTSEYQTFELLKDPRNTSTEEELALQFDFILSIQQKLSESHQAIKKMRKAKSTITDVVTKLNDEQDTLKNLGNDIIAELSIIENKLYQTKNESRQDPLNFPIKLTNKLGHVATLVMSGNFPPTSQDQAFSKEVISQIDDELKKIDVIFSEKIEAFNQLFFELQPPLIGALDK